MLRNHIILTIITFSAFFLGGCENEEVVPDPIDSSITDMGMQPLIEVFSPAPNRVYKPGDTLDISAQIKHDFTLHEYLLQIDETSSNRTLLQKLYHIHAGSSLDIDTFWVASASTNTELKLTIMANDHGGNVGRQEVIFKVMK